MSNGPTETTLGELAEVAIREITGSLPPGASAVVLISREIGPHSYYAARSAGACLPVIGLLDVGGRMIRSKMPEEFRA